LYLYVVITHYNIKDSYMFRSVWHHQRAVCT